MIAAGSLLELTLNASGFSMPVGRVQYLYMKPMSFEEFLLAQGQETVVEALGKDRACSQNRWFTTPCLTG